MFASLTLFPEFYKKHMKKFIALAPVLSCKSLGSKLLVDASKETLMYKALKKAGPEIMTSASAENFLTLLFANTTLGNAGGDMVTKRISDAKPELISK